MNQVKAEQSRIAKVIEGLGMFFKALSVNEEAINNRRIEEDLEEIQAFEDTEKIKSLEENTLKVNIPLKDSVVEKAKVSERKAKKVADEVKKSKIQEKNFTRQIGEE